MQQVIIRIRGGKVECDTKLTPEMKLAMLYGTGEAPETIIPRIADDMLQERLRAAGMHIEQLREAQG